jgi:hypothetical protein
MWIREQLGDVGGQKEWGVIGLTTSLLTRNLHPQPLVFPKVPFSRAIFMRARWKVCKRCNNEWMGQLQQRAKEIIGPAIDSKPIGLTPTEQGIIGNWGTMTAIMADYAHRQTVEEYRRREFFEHQEPPPNTQVLLLDVENDMQATPAESITELTTMYFNPRLVARHDQEQVHLYGCLFSIRRFGLLVVQGSLPPRQRALLDRITSQYTRVWPPTLKTLPWPPKTLKASAALNLTFELLGG